MQHIDKSKSISNKKAGLKTPSSFREEKRDGGGWKALDKHHSASANPAVLRQDNVNSPTALHTELQVLPDFFQA